MEWEEKGSEELGGRSWEGPSCEVTQRSVP